MKLTGNKEQQVQFEQLIHKRVKSVWLSCTNRGRQMVDQHRQLNVGLQCDAPASWILIH